MSTADDIFSRNPDFEDPYNPIVDHILIEQVRRPTELAPGFQPPTQEELIAENLGDMALEVYGIEPVKARKRWLP